jgi:hypothetical protein
MIYLIEDEDDVTRKKLAGCEDCNFAQSEGAVGCNPGCVSALPGLGSGE